MPNKLTFAALTAAVGLSFICGGALAQAPGGTLQLQAPTSPTYRAGGGGKPTTCTEAYRVALDECLGAGMGEVRCRGGHDAYLKSCLPGGGNPGTYWSQSQYHTGLIQQ